MNKFAKNKDCSERKRGWEWINLSNNEVDGHFLLKRRKSFFTAEDLELFVNAATGEMNLEMRNDEVEDEYWGTKYL